MPKSYVHTRLDRALSYALQQRMVAQTPGTKVSATLDTSHMPMLSQPEVLASLIAGLAR